MQDQFQEQMIDLNNNNFFSVTDHDRYVDFFFTDNRDNEANLLVPPGGQPDQELFEDKLFPAEGVKSEHEKGALYAHEQERKLQTKKKMKNTYASKIAKLIHEDNNDESVKAEEEVEGSAKQHFGYFEETSRQDEDGEGCGEGRKQDKLLKNRLSAQKSRKMKKEYMEILQDKVNELQEQLDTERKANEKNTEKLRRYTYHQAMLNGYFISRDQIFQKMEESLRTKASHEELQILLDSIRYRFAGTGKERLNLIRYYYEQIFDLMVPDLCKYAIHSAFKGVGIFNSKKDQNDIAKVLGTDADKQIQLKRLKEDLVLSRETISQIATDFAAVKERLEEEVRKIDQIFDQMRVIISPEAQIRCILFLQKNKYKLEYSAAWKDWKNIFTERLDKGSKQPRKLIKTES